MRGSDIRSTFLSFFEGRGHQVVPSSSLISPDPSLLLTTAGMVQFIPYFLGRTEPPYARAASVQKSFRTTDIQNVGLTARHLTFFEMLGNFSFGDYFKSEACAWAFELVTRGYGIDPDRLWITVFESDDEAIGVWTEEVGIPRDRIVRRGKDDNFWWTHAAGPGGPCSEIYVDRGQRYGPDGGPAVDEERFLEIWNLVFMQNEMDDDGNVVGDLPKKNIDTGSSLERVAVVLQEADSIFETDLMRPLLAVAEGLAGRKYGEDERIDVSLRILAEHGRATTFLIVDGVLPSNEGRGYVLRRMLRRMVLNAWKLDIEGDVTGPLIERTTEVMADAYPDLEERKPFALQVGASEEENFRATLRQGITRFEEEVERTKASGTGTFSGDAAFLYHDTYGFPIEMTVELAEEQDLRVDTETFERLMTEQRKRAREAARGGPDEAALVDLAREAGRTEFIGYERLEAEARLEGLVAHGRSIERAGESEEVEIVLDRTPFYAEAGGQVGDSGVIRTETGEARVEETGWGPGELIVHRARVTSGEVRRGQEATAQVDAARRAATARSHTGTHVVHWTLRHVLGEHARQAGSLVAPGRLRFDFTHFEGLSPATLEEIEGVANSRLAENDPVRAYETTPEFARTQGAIALFGEKYGDIVRVVEVGDYSVELCGGTHVARTGEVALALVVSEAGIGSGLRRIEALVGPDALAHLNLERRLLEEVSEALGAGDPRQAPERARQAVARIKELESELTGLRGQERGKRVADLVAGARDIAGVALVVAEIPGEDPGRLRELALSLRNQLERNGHGAAVLGSADAGKATLVASCTKALVDRGVTAPDLLEPAARAVGGGAGGKPHLAFAGGGKAGALSEALSTIPERLAALLGGG